MRFEVRGSRFEVRGSSTGKPSSRRTHGLVVAAVRMEPRGCWIVASAAGTRIVSGTVCTRSSASGYVFSMVSVNVFARASSDRTASSTSSACQGHQSCQIAEPRRQAVLPLPSRRGRDSRHTDVGGSTVRSNNGMKRPGPEGTRGVGARAFGLSQYAGRTLTSIRMRSPGW